MRALLNDHQKVALPGSPKVDTARRTYARNFELLQRGKYAKHETATNAPFYERCRSGSGRFPVPGNMGTGRSNRKRDRHRPRFKRSALGGSKRESRIAVADRDGDDRFHRTLRPALARSGYLHAQPRQERVSEHIG